MAILYGDEEHTLEDAGFDRLLRRKDVIEDEERQFQQRIEEQRNQHERRERTRIERLKLTNGNVLLYAIRKIIEVARIHGSQAGKIQITAYELGFEESIVGVISATNFLRELEKQGYIKEAERINNEYVCFSYPDTSKLEEYAARINSLPNSVEPVAPVLEKTQEAKHTSCGLLIVDFNAGTMSYNNNSRIEISPDTREVKMLKLLMTTNDVVQYWEIAKSLNLPIYRDEMQNNKKYARDVQFVRRELGKMLKGAGMKLEEINKMIISKKNLGYVLRCKPDSLKDHRKVT